MPRANSLEKSLMLGKIEGRRRRGWKKMRWLDSITDSMDLKLSTLREIDSGNRSLVCCSPWGCKELDMTERLTSTKFPCHLTHCHVAAIHNIHFPCQNLKCVFQLLLSCLHSFPQNLEKAKKRVSLCSLWG